MSIFIYNFPEYISPYLSLNPLKLCVAPLKRLVAALKCQVAPPKRSALPLKCCVVPIKCRVVPIKCCVVPIKCLMAMTQNIMPNANIYCCCVYIYGSHEFDAVSYTHLTLPTKRIV